MTSATFPFRFFVHLAASSSPVWPVLLFGLLAGRGGGAEEPALGVPPLVAPENGDTFVDAPESADDGDAQGDLYNTVKGVAEIESMRAYGPEYNAKIAGGGTGLWRVLFLLGAYAFACSSDTS